MGMNGDGVILLLLLGASWLVGAGLGLLLGEGVYASCCIASVTTAILGGFAWGLDRAARVKTGRHSRL